jgi:hypothetical protein
MELWVLKFMNKNTVSKPNFFLIGAPRSGSTALSEYLRLHPDLFFSDQKELHYFSTDYPKKDRRNSCESEEEYLNHFIGADGSIAVGEGSVWYMYSKVAIQNILEYIPTAKFLIIVRNQIDMARSIHRRSFSNGQEDIKNFQEAWEAQGDRKNGKRVPEFCTFDDVLQYEEMCSIGGHVQRLVSIIPHGFLKIVFLEDFEKKPIKVYKEVLEFLGLNPNRIALEQDQFKVVNASFAQKSKAFSRILLVKKYHPRAYSKIRSLILKSPVLARFFRRIKVLVHSGIRHWGQSSEYDILDVEFEKKLKMLFMKDTKLLEKNSTRDLSHWN